MQRWSGLALALLLVPLLAGCFGSDKAERNDDELPPAQRWDPMDPRLPHLPDGSLDGVAAGTVGTPGFPIFSDPVPMNHTFRAARETSLALGPDGSGLRFACDPSGVPNTAGGQSYFYLSTDNGTTWSDLDVERAQTDPRTFFFEGGDCDVAIGPDGELWTADSWLGSLSIGRSLDAGETWTGTPLGGPAPVADRPWLVAKAGGMLHLTYQDVQFGMPSAIWYTRLAGAEGPVAFLPATLVAGASPDGGFTWTGNLVVSEDSDTLWSVYTRRAGPTVSDLEGSGPETVWVARSTDGGVTWTSIRVSDRPAPASFLYASIAQDAGGILHVVFAQRTETAHPVWHSYSTDEGSTWSEPVAVREDVAGYSPWVAGGQAGQAAIQWYGSPDPKATLDGDHDWYTYWATITGIEAGNATYRSGTTTIQPFHNRTQGETPEFNQVRLDPQGRMHMGISAIRYDEENDSARWVAYYQQQVGGPTV